MGDRVLVVDDEREIRDLLGNFLEGEGYEVIFSSNGEEAIDLAKRDNPQVILLDAKMPGIGGIETCKRLRSGKETAFIPIIMITGYADRKTDAIEAGVDDFLYKPFSATDLFIRVKSILRMRYLTNELERVTAYIEELEKNRPQV